MSKATNCFHYAIREKPFRQSFSYVAKRIWPFSAIYFAIRSILSSESAYERFNRRSRIEHQKDNYELSQSQLKIVHSLRLNGGAVSHLSSLLKDSDLLNELQAQALAMQAEPEFIASCARREGEDNLRFNLVRWRGQYKRNLGIPDSFAKTFLSQELLTIVNEYFGLRARLHYVDLWCSMPVSGSRPDLGSELWHRDYEDRNLLKVFIYLSDVDEKMGPFSYIEGTHRESKHHGMYPDKIAQGPQVESDSECAGTIMQCTGPVGTVVFADSSGFHRGGRPSKNRRIVLVAFFSSDAAYGRTHYEPSQQIRDELSPVARWALKTSSKPRFPHHRY